MRMHTNVYDCTNAYECILMHANTYEYIRMHLRTQVNACVGECI